METILRCKKQKFKHNAPFWAGILNLCMFGHLRNTAHKHAHHKWVMHNIESQISVEKKSFLLWQFDFSHSQLEEWMWNSWQEEDYKAWVVIVTSFCVGLRLNIANVTDYIGYQCENAIEKFLLRPFVSSWQSSNPLNPVVILIDMLVSNEETTLRVCRRTAKVGAEHILRQIESCWMAT